MDERRLYNDLMHAHAHSGAPFVDGWWTWVPLQGGAGGSRPTQYFYFLTLRLWALHGKNRLQKAFVPLNIRRLAERLVVDGAVACPLRASHHRVVTIRSLRAECLPRRYLTIIKHI